MVIFHSYVNVYQRVTLTQQPCDPRGSTLPLAGIRDPIPLPLCGTEQTMLFFHNKRCSFEISSFYRNFIFSVWVLNSISSLFKNYGRFGNSLVFIHAKSKVKPTLICWYLEDLVIKKNRHRKHSPLTKLLEWYSITWWYSRYMKDDINSIFHQSSLIVYSPINPLLRIFHQSSIHPSYTHYIYIVPLHWLKHPLILPFMIYEHSIAIVYHKV